VFGVVAGAGVPELGFFRWRASHPFVRRFSAFRVRSRDGFTT
jgi:hypothetical protein